MKYCLKTEKYCLKTQTKRAHTGYDSNFYTFTPKCYNIFKKYLFSILVDHNFIFYYFISVYKKLIPQ